MTCVREFHEAADQTIAEYPSVPSDAVIRLRLRLIREEYDEVMADLAWLLHHPDAPMDDKLSKLRDLLKELCDLRYVVEGTAVSFGLPIDEAYAEVHASNMSKRWPGEAKMRKDDGGKALKGPEYRTADMDKFVVLVEEEVSDIRKLAVSGRADLQ